jgi:hypothetical protein
VKRNLLRAVAGLLGLAPSFTAHLFAQQLASLSATVAHPSGRIISQARVALCNGDTGAKRRHLSSSEGSAVIPALAHGELSTHGRVRSIQPPSNRAEVFNLFDRPNVNGIDTVYGAAYFLGPIPQKFRDGVNGPANPTFGAPNFVAQRGRSSLQCG